MKEVSGNLISDTKYIQMIAINNSSDSYYLTIHVNSIDAEFAMVEGQSRWISINRMAAESRIKEFEASMEGEMHEIISRLAQLALHKAIKLRD